MSTVTWAAPSCHYLLAESPQPPGKAERADTVAFHPWPSSQHSTAGTQVVFSVGAGAGAKEDAVDKVMDQEGALSL